MERGSSAYKKLAQYLYTIESDIEDKGELREVFVAMFDRDPRTSGEIMKDRMEALCNQSHKS